MPITCRFVFDHSAVLAIVRRAVVGKLYKLTCTSDRPTHLPRSRFRRASRDVKELCARHGVIYHEQSFGRLVWKTLQHLRTIGRLVDLDIRK